MILRVLVVDDSVVFRRVIAGALASLPDAEVVGSVANGKLALQRVRELRPDLLTLDLEMPEIDGLGVLDALRQAGETVTVIVVSALTRQGSQVTLRALEKGAFDFITKPDLPSAEQSREAIRQELAPRLRALANGWKSATSCARSQPARRPRPPRIRPSPRPKRPRQAARALPDA